MMIINRKILTLLAVIISLCGLTLKADGPGRHGDREKWMSEMRQYKHDFIVKQLKLTDEQKARFIQVYQRMEIETDELNHQTRSLMRSVEKKGSEATDLEMEKAAEASFELKSKEGAIEMRYYKELKSILSPRQMLELRKAERKFTRELMKHQQKKQKD